MLSPDEYALGLHTAFASLQIVQDFSRTSHDASWHTCQFCHVHTVAATNTARRYAVQKDDAALFIIVNRHGIDTQMWQLVRHKRQFVIMGREKGACSRRIMQMLNHGMGNGDPIIRARSSPDFIENN